VIKADVADMRSKKAYERYGEMILSASALLGIVAAVVTTMPPLSAFSNGVLQNTYPIMGALGTALVGFNLLALVITLVPYKRGEKWAWFTLWLLPLGWVSQFVFLPHIAYLVLAVLTAVGLALPFRRFFFRIEEPARVE
jgi:hypothetical protein